MNKKLDKNIKINIALFGGSFDPPHIGHFLIVREALHSLDIDKLFVVPTYLNPFKKDFFAPATLRYQWLEKLFKNNNKISILEYEIKQEKAIPTIETVKYLYSQYKIDTLYLIIGADNLEKLHLWQDFNTLKKLVTFVVVSRKGYVIPKNLINLKISANISSTKLRKKMDDRFIPTSLHDEIKNFYKRKNE